jgi:hypothetical protein
MDLHPILWQNQTAWSALQRQQDLEREMQIGRDVSNNPEYKKIVNHMKEPLGSTQLDYAKKLAQIDTFMNRSLDMIPKKFEVK